MNAKKIRERLNNDQSVFGLFSSHREPMLTELYGRAGFEFVILDGEHGVVDAADIPALALAAERANCCPLIRPPSLASRTVGRPLDFGAQGVVAPMIESKADADQLADACLYPPQGKRGLGLTRSVNFGIDNDPVEAMKVSNDELLLIAQIETRTGIESLPEILKCDRLDMIFVGPADLSTSLGVPLQFEHPDFIQAIVEIASQTQAAGKHLGVLVSEPDQVQTLQQLGFRFFACYADMLISNAAKTFLESSRNH